MKGVDIILVNGPPRSGKDTFSNMLIDAAFMSPMCQTALGTATIRSSKSVSKFAAPIRRSIASFFNWHPQYAEEMFEHKKDELLMSDRITLRHAMIELSERWAKGLWGRSVFAWVLADHIKRSVGQVTTISYKGDRHLYVVSDLGFIEEAEHFLQQFGAESLLIVQMSREGCSYIRDSRSYVELTHEGVPMTSIINNCSLSELSRRAELLMYSFLNQRVNQDAGNTNYYSQWASNHLSHSANTRVPTSSEE